MAFQTILTTAGLAAQAAAVASDVPINLVAVAVGDGNGNATTPSLGQTALVREVYRAAPNRVEVNPENDQQYMVELIIPAATGGWVIREFGIFDDNGTLIAVGNFPATYKTVPADGATSDLVLQTIVEVSNAGVITIVLDPAATVATRTWVINNITPAALFPGGTTGQVLRKKSNADGDTEWADPATANILVNTREEPVQTLADGQTTVNLTATTTTGLAVFIEGIRIWRGAGANRWQQGASNTQVVLGKSYPAGTSFCAAQNEPAGLIPNPLDSTKNLSDVQSASTSRTNLDVFSKAESRQLAPPSQIAYFARNSPPAGWLKANGAALSRVVYADLFAAIGTTFGAGDGTSTFNLPDLRGEFLRGWDDGRGIDIGRSFGQTQNDAIRNIFGTFDGNVDDGQNQKSGAFFSTGASFTGSNGDANGPGGVIGFNASLVVPTANENRPRNVALLACIKF